MKQAILNTIIIISAIVMILDVIFYYGIPEGRMTMVISSLICIIAYIVSDYLEDKEED